MTDFVPTTTPAGRTQHLSRPADLATNPLIDGRSGQSLCRVNNLGGVVMDQERYAADRARWSSVPVKPIADMPLCRRCAKQSTAEGGAS